MEQGWDPEIKKYFIKILNSISLGLLWMIVCATSGIYFKLAYGKPVIYAILFYIAMALSLALLIRWYYITWKK